MVLRVMQFYDDHDFKARIESKLDILLPIAEWNTFFFFFSIMFRFHLNFKNSEQLFWRALRLFKSRKFERQKPVLAGGVRRDDEKGHVNTAKHNVYRYWNEFFSLVEPSWRRSFIAPSLSIPFLLFCNKYFCCAIHKLSFRSERKTWLLVGWRKREEPKHQLSMFKEFWSLARVVPFMDSKKKLLYIDSLCLFDSNFIITFLCFVDDSDEKKGNVTLDTVELFDSRNVAMTSTVNVWS